MAPALGGRGGRRTPGGAAGLHARGRRFVGRGEPGRGGRQHGGCAGRGSGDGARAAGRVGVPPGAAGRRTARSARRSQRCLDRAGGRAPRPAADGVGRVGRPTARTARPRAAVRAGRLVVGLGPGQARSDGVLRRGDGAGRAEAAAEPGLAAGRLGACRVRCRAGRQPRAQRRRRTRARRRHRTGPGADPRVPGPARRGGGADTGPDTLPRRPRRRAGRCARRRGRGRAAHHGPAGPAGRGRGGVSSGRPGRHPRARALRGRDRTAGRPHLAGTGARRAATEPGGAGIGRQQREPGAARGRARRARAAHWRRGARGAGAAGAGLPVAACGRAEGAAPRQPLSGHRLAHRARRRRRGGVGGGGQRLRPSGAGPARRARGHGCHRRADGPGRRRGGRPARRPAAAAVATGQSRSYPSISRSPPLPSTTWTSWRSSTVRPSSYV